MLRGVTQVRDQAPLRDDTRVTSEEKRQHFKRQAAEITERRVTFDEAVTDADNNNS
jgi:hypothetical protein